MCSCEDYPFLYVWQCGWKRGCVEASNKANKWQNKHRQSWFRPLIQCCTDMSSSYSLMMHLSGCFLLTRLFQGYPFYRARWCHCKVFWVSHPRPHLPLQSVSCVLQVYCVLCVCMCEAREEELSNMHSKKNPLFVVVGIFHLKKTMPSIVSRSWFCLDCMWEVHCKCWPTTIPFTVIPFYCPFTNLWQWRLHYGKMVCILAYSVAVRSLYHCDTMVRSSLVDAKSFRSDHQAKLSDKKAEIL